MKAIKRTYLGLVLAFLYLPLLMIILFSFSSSKLRSQWGHFTLDWYVKLFRSANIMEALYNTLLVAVLAMIISTIVGTIAAIGIYGMKERSRNMIMNVTYLPVINPDIVTGISLMILFIFLKMSLGFPTMLIAHIVFDIPFVIISILPRLKQLDISVYEAALDLGATPFVAARKVILPHIAPGIITGAILAFTLSIDDFVISFFTTSGFENLSIHIYSSVRKGVEPTMYALMTIMFVAILALMLIVYGRSTKEEKK